MITLQELLRIKGRPELVTASLNDTVSSAVERMVENDFHQLPVVDNSKRPIGLVSTISVANAQRTSSKALAELHVADAIEFTEQFGLGADLFVVLNALKERSAILVVDGSNQLKGILTSYDALVFFRCDMEDQHLVKSVEKHLIECLNLADSEQRDNPPEAFRTFNFYMDKFLSQANWPKWSDIIGIPLAEMRTLLDRVRRIRNAFAHHQERSWRERDHVRMVDTLLSRSMPAIRSKLEPPRPAPSGSAAEPSEAPVERKQEYGEIIAELQRVPLDMQTVDRSFAELEVLLSHPLSETARTQEYWWNGAIEGNVPARNWYDLGWLAQVDLSSQQVTFRRLREREREYTRFFTELLRMLREPGAKNRGAAPSGRSYHRIARLTRGAFGGDLNVAFSIDKRFRIELYINTPERERNKHLFDALLARRESVERELSGKLDWDRIDDAQVSRIAWYRDTFITDGPQALTELRAWATEQIPKFRKVMEMEIAAVREKPTTVSLTTSQPIDEQ